MRILRLTFGIFLFSLGIVFTINANMGIAPWDTFHQGLSLQTGITFGQASIVVGLSILIVNYFLGEKIGFGTIINVFGIGIILDWLFLINIIPVMTTTLFGIVGMTIGMITIALGSYFYLGAGFGAGPRDGLMVGLHKKTSKSIGFIRASIEITVLIIGAILGGSVGLGTLFLALFIGPIVQVTFKILKFDVKKIKHTYLLESKT